MQGYFSCTDHPSSVFLLNMSKSPYPFYPFQDSLLGQILNQMYSEKGEQENLKNALNAHLVNEEESFVFTARSEKQIYFETFPPKARKWMEKKDTESFHLEFQSLLKRRGDSAGKMDIVLEIMEWLISGFEENNMCADLLNKSVFPGLNLLPEDIPEIRKRYFSI